MNDENYCIICRCEEIAAREIETAIAAGARTVNDVKRVTRAGMGVCQGIFCVPAIIDALVAATGAAPASFAPLTVRPPVRPIPVGAMRTAGDQNGD